MASILPHHEQADRSMSLQARTRSPRQPQEDGRCAKRSFVTMSQKRAQTRENPEKHAKHVQTQKTRANTPKCVKTQKKKASTCKKRAKNTPKRPKTRQNAQKCENTQKRAKNTQKNQKNAKNCVFPRFCLGFASACLGLPRPPLASFGLPSCARPNCAVLLVLPFSFTF